MMLWGANSLQGLLRQYRLCWISGHFGGGKTSLGFRLAYDFLREGYRLVTNCACVWADDLGDLALLDEGEHKDKLRAVCVLDEGGLYFKSSDQIEQIAAYAAKMDCIYIIPSFFPPVRAAQVLNIQPVFGFRSTGIPLIVYKWRVKLGSFDERGSFMWWRPSEIYGVYSRQDPGADPDDVVDFLGARMEDFRARHGHGKKAERVRGVDRGGGRYSPSTMAVVADAASTFADAADVISSASVSKRKRRRR